MLTKLFVFKTTVVLYFFKAGRAEPLRTSAPLAALFLYFLNRVQRYNKKLRVPTFPSL